MLGLVCWLMFSHGQLNILCSSGLYLASLYTTYGLVSAFCGQSNDILALAEGVAVG